MSEYTMSWYEISGKPGRVPCTTDTSGMQRLGPVGLGDKDTGIADGKMAPLESRIDRTTSPAFHLIRENVVVPAASQVHYETLKTVTFFHGG